MLDGPRREVEKRERAENQLLSAFEGIVFECMQADSTSAVCVHAGKSKSQAECAAEFNAKTSFII